MRTNPKIQGDVATANRRVANTSHVTVVINRPNPGRNVTELKVLTFIQITRVIQVISETELACLERPTGSVRP